MQALDLQHVARRIAPLAYAAYGKTTDNKNYQGLPMPEWEELPEKIQLAWYAAIHKSFEEFLTLMENSLKFNHIN